MMERHNRQHRAFSLVELLMVVAVIGILSAAALPNYLEAQTRAKVSASKANINTLTVALEVYAVDNHAYPSTRALFPEDRLGILAEKQCLALVHPINYLGNATFKDPFARARELTYFRDLPSRPAPRGINATNSLLYFNYTNLAINWEMPCLERKGAAVVSLGPDNLDSLGAYRPVSVECFRQMYPYSGGAHHPVNTVYDPTNGTVSLGDIAGFVGDGRIFAHP